MSRTRAGLTLAAAIALWLIAGAGVAQTHTICEVQAYDEQGLSPLRFEVVTVVGVVTATPGYLQSTRFSMFIELDGCGVNVYGGSDVSPGALGLALGDTVLVTGEVTEYISGSAAGATTEIVITAADAIEIISNGPIPDPTYFGLKDLGREENEGRFVRAIGVVGETNYNDGMTIGEPWSNGEIQIFQGFNDSTDFGGFDIGDTVDITGIVGQYDRDTPYFDGYQLSPRFQTDMRMFAPPQPPPPAYFPNASLQVPAFPFRPDVGDVLEIAYSAPEGSEVVMEIFDLQGRRIRTLTETKYAGQSSLPELYRNGYLDTGVRGWDGRDDLRRMVPAGVYLCRLEAKARDGRVTATTAPIVVGIKLD